MAVVLIRLLFKFDTSFDRGASTVLYKQSNGVTSYLCVRVCVCVLEVLKE